MGSAWAVRQRNTNRLVRTVARFIFDNRKPVATQLYGLCRLTWITKGASSAVAPYVKSTKIPALGQIFKEDFTGWPLDQVADRIAILLDDPSARTVVKLETGFTNFYTAYRNSSLTWIEGNFSRLLPLFRAAYRLADDQQGERLVTKLKDLPLVPKANNPSIAMRTEFLLTPVFFALDPRRRFPLINGNQGVQDLLKRLNVSKQTLESQYQKMIALYGHGGISDAADLDQAGDALSDFISLNDKPAIKKLLGEQRVKGARLPIKDDEDVESIRSAQTVKSRRQHNTLTNQLRGLLSAFTLYEGRAKHVMFDVLVNDYNKKERDLLIEVKSSDEIAHVRMAIGQLFSYQYGLKSSRDVDLAILLPSFPGPDVANLLAELRIGLLWISNGSLKSATDWLRPFLPIVADNNNGSGDTRKPKRPNARMQLRESS